MTSSRLRSCAATAVAVFASATLFGGCGAEEPPKACAPVGPLTATVAGAPTQTVVLKERGFNFLIPAGWTTIDRTGSADAVDADVKDLAQVLGTTPDQVEQFFQFDTVETEFIAMNAKDTDDDVLEAVTVMPVDDAKARDKGLANDLEMMALILGGNISERSRAVDTPIGLGYTLSYSVREEGIVEERRALVTGTSPDSQVMITVSTTESSRGDELMGAIRASLAEQC